MESPDQSSEEVILNLDEPLRLLALQEASRCLHQAQHLVVSGRLARADLLDLLSASQLRLTYLLLSCPVPELERRELAKLQAFSHRMLASQLLESQRSQALLRRG